MRDRLPPFFLNSDENSFAKKTFLYRKPQIIRKIISSNNFNDIQRKALEQLASDLTGGVVRNPFYDFPYKCKAIEPDFKKIWDEELRYYLKKKWLELPFYFAEALLYFEILVAVGYFDPSSNFFMRDIYNHFKDRELFGENGALKGISPLLSKILPLKDSFSVVKELLYFSLWGNRIDLSMYHIVEEGKSLFLSKDHEKRLIIDHSAAIARYILNATRVDFVLDNAGQELVCDLLLVWAALNTNKNLRVFLHLKKYPFYVSDAMKKDFFITLDCFKGLNVDFRNPHLVVVGKDLSQNIKSGRLTVLDHYFWNSSLGYSRLPGELYRDFESSDLVIFKGDVNYRRLLDDRRWDISENMERLVAYFPTSIAVIRTMKSELVVDIPWELSQKLDNEDPEWKVNGLRGIIRLIRLK